MKTIAEDAGVDGLHRLFESFAQTLTPAAARKLIKFRADRVTQNRIATLAEKCNEGELTSAERSEYESFVRAIDFISLLQAEARVSLSKSRKK